MKAVRSIELGLDTLRLPKNADKTDDEIRELLHVQDDERIFAVFEALYRGIDFDTIYAATKIDKWFLGKLWNLARIEHELEKGSLDKELYLEAKDAGFLDKTIERISGVSCAPYHRKAAYKMVDTCAAEFQAQTPYFYSTFDEENEAEIFLERNKNDKKKVLVFGSGPIRIGQGIEFDYYFVCMLLICINTAFEVHFLQ